MAPGGGAWREAPHGARRRMAPGDAAAAGEATPGGAAAAVEAARAGAAPGCMICDLGASWV